MRPSVGFDAGKLGVVARTRLGGGARARAACVRTDSAIPGGETALRIKRPLRLLGVGMRVILQAVELRRVDGPPGVYAAAVVIRADELAPRVGYPESCR